MDDPWGSPWTTTDGDKDHKPPSPTKSDLEPPPRAFFSVSNSPRIPATTGQTPWGDDEQRLGDWAAAETPASTHSAWGGGWAPPSPNLASPPRNDRFGQNSPIAWPGSIAVPKPINGSALRQPSPDPWSIDFSVPTPSNDGLSTPRFHVNAPSVATVHKEAEVDVEAVENINGEEVPSWHGAGEGNLDKDLQSETVHSTVNHTGESVSSRQGPDQQVPPADSVRPSVDSIHDSHESRAPSRLDDVNDNIDHEDEQQDSPITSIDEDSRSRARQQVARKTSGKVQELVSKFDGLARAASQEPSIIGRDRSKSTSTRNVNDDSDSDSDSEADDAGGFGDFKDVDVDDAQAPATPARVATPRLASESPLSLKHVRGSFGPPPGASSPESKKGATNLAHVQFDVDLSNLDKLFSAVKRGSVADIIEPDSDIPDRIINDSFTEISERKTWYRISRLGSSRKHDAGDDDNYRRVTWPTSAVRQDTTKVVRRWMEEDSIAGRVTLGGGISKTQKNMFGWDSSVEPVALNAAFGKKKAHSRASSLQQFHNLGLPSPDLEPPQRKISGAVPSLTQRPISLTGPPVASFGWSTGSPTAPVRTSSRKVDTEPLPSLSKPSSLVSLEPVRPTSEKTAPLAVATKAPTFQDDDDDWGEMVSSPTGPKPAINGFQTIDDAFTAPPPTLAIPPVIPQVLATPATKLHNVPNVLPNNTATANNPWASVNLACFESPTTTTTAAPGEPIAAQSITSPTTAATPASSSMVPLYTGSAKPVSVAPEIPGVALPKALGAILTDGDFTPTTPRAITSPVILPEMAAGKQRAVHTSGVKADESSEHDEIVQRIIANLPDLSYMLR